MVRNTLVFLSEKTSMMSSFLRVSIMVIPIFLILTIIMIPASAQIESIDDRPTIIGKPTEPLDCERISDDCLPNKRMIVYAIYENADGKGDKLDNILRTQQDSKKPWVVELEPQKSVAERYTIVNTSFEFENSRSSSIDDIKFEMSRERLFTDAAFIRVTTFDTWHHFGEDNERPCELIDVLEFGDLDLYLFP